MSAISAWFNGLITDITLWFDGFAADFHTVFIEKDRYEQMLTRSFEYAENHCGRTAYRYCNRYCGSGSAFVV